MPKFIFENIAINSTAKKKPTEQDKDTYIGLEHLDPQCLEVTRFGGDVAPIGEKLLMKKGDVLFGKRRAYQKKVGIAPFDGIFSAHGLVLRPKEEVITKEFFPFFISSDYFLDKAIEISVGSLSPTINWSDLKKLEFNIPEIDKQKKYAPILWSFNDTKNKYLKLLADLNLLINSQFIEMVNKINNYVELGSICKPKQWKTIATKQFTTTGYPVYGANGLIGYYSEYNHEDPTLMIGCRGTCGVVHISEPKSYINGNAMCLDNLDEGVDINYLKYALDCFDFKKITTGSTQPQIIASVLEKIKIALPKLDEQKAFAERAKLIDKSKFLIQKIQKNIIFLINFLKSNKKYINYAIIKARKLQGEHYV